jgi:hypothetical protein
MSKPKRNSPKPGKRSRKTLAETTAELVAEMGDSPRSDAVFAPIAFEDEDDDFPRQTLPMAVIRGWFK